MTAARLEHANLTVGDPARFAAFLCRVFGWHIRWEGPSMLGGHTIHVGSESDYLALYTRNADSPTVHAFSKGQPLNHIGLLVDDLDTVEKGVRAEGYAPFGHDDYEPGRRFYFFDGDGIEFEVISYA